MISTLILFLFVQQIMQFSSQLWTVLNKILVLIVASTGNYRKNQKPLVAKYSHPDLQALITNDFFDNHFQQFSCYTQVNINSVEPNGSCC